jgi:hypothetical protein
LWQFLCNRHNFRELISYTKKDMIEFGKYICDSDMDIAESIDEAVNDIYNKWIEEIK